MGRIGYRNRILRKEAEMQRTNTILKRELREQWEEVKELKALLALMNKDLLPLRDLDPEETIKFIKEYKAKKFN